MITLWPFMESLVHLATFIHACSLSTNNLSIVWSNSYNTKEHLCLVTVWKQIKYCSVKKKRLGYHINGFDMKRWANDGYSLCLDGIQAKFHQNNDLLMMLKSMAPKTTIEASMDKLWGTGISLRDHQALNPKKWCNRGWMSAMLTEIYNDQNNILALHPNPEHQC